MNKIINIQKSLFIFGIPLAIITLMVLLTNSTLFSSNANKLSVAVILDLLITTPLVYFILIRKTTIPKITVVPLIILGVIVASYIIPTKHQYFLELFKTWMLPIIELVVLSFVIYNVIKAIRLYKQNKTDNSADDFFTILKSTCYMILPKGAVIPFVTEIAVIYYGFINWKKRQLKTNEFSYHKDSVSVGILIAILFLIAIETLALHLLLAKWNTTAAWILTGISVYSGIQILGFLKSMYKRPIIIEDHKLCLRYGIMNETTINIKDIDSIMLSTKDIELNKTTRKLSFLGDLEGHNLIISLKEENKLTGLYGINRTYKVLAFHVDEKVKFKNYVESLIKIETLN